MPNKQNGSKKDEENHGTIGRGYKFNSFVHDGKNTAVVYHDRSSVSPSLVSSLPKEKTILARNFPSNFCKSLYLI